MNEYHPLISDLFQVESGAEGAWCTLGRGGETLVIHSRTKPVQPSRAVPPQIVAKVRVFTMKLASLKI